MSLSPERRAILLMAAFVALWAAIEALASGVLRRYSPYQVVWMRYMVHLLFMLAVWGWREPASLWRTRRPLIQFVRSLLMLGMPASWFMAMQAGVDVGTLVAVFWLSPLLILAFASIFLGERGASALWLAALVACGGAWLLAQPRLPASPGILVYPLAMAVTFSLYVVMTRSLKGESPRANLFHTALWVAVALTPQMPSLWVAPTAPDLLAIIAVGLLGFAALLALDRSAAAAPVSVTAPASSLQLCFTVAVASLLGQGRPGGAAMAGLLLIVAAVLYVWAVGRTNLLRGFA